MSEQLFIEILEAAERIDELEEDNKRLRAVWDAVAAVKERWRGSTISSADLVKNREYWGGVKNIFTVHYDALKESNND